jgi:hypothetical protein
MTQATVGGPVFVHGPGVVGTGLEGAVRLAGGRVATKGSNTKTRIRGGAVLKTPSKADGPPREPRSTRCPRSATIAVRGKCVRRPRRVPAILTELGVLALGVWIVGEHSRSSSPSPPRHAQRRSSSEMVVANPCFPPETRWRSGVPTPSCDCSIVAVTVEQPSIRLGPRMLAEFAQRMREHITSGDIAFRKGLPQRHCRPD